ncbi:HAMP domain-containing sensor histidine kinase [Flavobacterium sp. B183]|uniref:sensor histidine kinase n=1 Tax=Flavobacterium sp. B183 TaxID=907046 RepID=UPI00201F5876|nr:HAMP domain-containing sensor histidine kinase [Flavobacterium sp. B183]URC11818.1 HAMP domain-containing histidine kinase [Flavobacterium sp. B183]
MSKTLNSMDSLNRITNFTSGINNSFVNSQKSFNNYTYYKDKESLNKYTASLNEISRLIDSLTLITKDNKEFMRILKEKNQSENSVESIKLSIDSIIESQINPDKTTLSKPFKLNKFAYKKILDSIKTDSYIKVDSVSKKGLFSRLGAALAGKVDVQKEQLKITVTMKYDNKVVTGSIEEQFANLFNTTNKFYEEQFKNLKRSFANLKDQDAKLKEFNNELLNLEAEIMPNYNNSLKLLQDNTQKQLQKQYDSNKIARSYTIAILILMMFIVSLVLFGFTRLAFQYEKRLTIAQMQIRENLNFKNRIMGMISHEIRSPLSIISIYSKMISASIKDAEIKDTFKSIQFTTNSLLLLANQILEYSKDGNYESKLNNKKFLLKEEIHQIVNSMASLVESKGNKIEVNSNLISNLEVNSDAAKIHQLFYNIIGNANKFTENGLIKIAMDLEETSDKQVNLKIEIEDSGIGIAKNDLKNIFELYYQGTVSGKVNDLGVGLGLNLCKEIVELFDGKIDVQSEEGKGTTIIFNLFISLV